MIELLNEIYWISGAEDFANSSTTIPVREKCLAQISHILEGVLFRGRVRPDWIDEIHWIAEAECSNLMAPALTANGFSNTPAAFSWPGVALLDHHLINAAGRAILIGERHLELVGQQVKGAMAASLLASPAAIGRYNLVPSGRLVLLPAGVCTPENLLSIVGQIVEQSGRKADAVLAVAPVGVTELPPGVAQSPFHLARWLTAEKPEASGATFQLNCLTGWMEENKADLGLMYSATPGSPLLATLVERI